MKEKCLIIEGGHALGGKITASGSKNAALPCLAASTLTNERLVLRNLPDVRDVRIMAEILEELGAKVKLDISKKIVEISAGSISAYAIPNRLSSEMRASVFLLGALLGRCSRVRIHGYGGCPIGSRPINLHLKAFRSLGAKVINTNELIEIRTAKLRGARIDLDIPSVGATENIILASSLAEGKTIINNAAMEPEVFDLIRLLVSMGADITASPRSIIVKGKKDLGRAVHKVIPDRIETGTYAIAAVITNGDVTIQKCRPDHLVAAIDKLRETGATVSVDGGSLHVISNRGIKAAEVITAPYPGFPTDLQPQFTSLASVAEGTSNIYETIFEKRFNHVPQLKKMGANIRINGQTLAVKGSARLFGTVVNAIDIRGGAALVLGALKADGKTIIRGAGHIDRGYEHMEEKLKTLGARIKRV